MAETPREPDRYDKLAKELLRGIDYGASSRVTVHAARTVLAAALRAAGSSALERAAQVADESREDGRCIAFAIRALRQAPAAAPAAETITCGPSCPGHPPSEPAPPEKDLLPPCTCHYAAAEFCKYHGPRLRAERAASVAPAPLLPRVLAVVNADAKHSGDPALIYLAAELRAYIAKAKGEGK